MVIPVITQLDRLGPWRPCRGLGRLVRGIIPPHENEEPDTELIRVRATDAEYG
jgi:hypothetical protein